MYQKPSIIVCFVLLACQGKDSTKITEVTGPGFPERAKDMTIYEVNIRQHTAEGTFAAFEKDLPRLKELGVDMLWIMPIQEIGERNRKGHLGSYYSIRDYKAVNKEFGTMDDFKSLVKQAHTIGMSIILDWVPNHSAWDHPWVTSHPEYYMTDSAAQAVGRTLGVAADYYKKKGVGDLVYEADWDDIALLNHHHPGTRAAMIDAMKYWIVEADIDGFRCDHAGHEIPMFFWEEAAQELNPLKDLFWLAEWDEPRMHTVFDATYDWDLLSLTERVADGEATVDELHEHVQRDLARYGTVPFRLNMITNHDRNAWEGTIQERYGEGDRAFAVFSFTAYGTPVIYSGQEAGLDKRLRFFDKDTISWADPNHHFEFYQALVALKSDHPALWNGAYGAMPLKLDDMNPNVFSFVRTRDNDKVAGVINLSAAEQSVTLSEDLDGFHDVFTNRAAPSGTFTIPPWGYYIFVR